MTRFLPLAVLLLAVWFVLARTMFAPPTYDPPADLSPESAEQAPVQTGTDIYLQLADLHSALPERFDELLEFAKRQDGAGYWARIYAANHLDSLGRHIEAAELVRSALSMRPWAEPSSLRPLRQLLARMLEQAGEREQALWAWAELLPEAEALARVSKLALDPVELGALLVQKRMHSVALSALQAVECAKACVYRARAYSALGRHLEAEAEYRKHLEIDPDDAVARLGFAETLERLGRYQAALREYEECGEAGIMGSGRVLALLGRKNEAIVAFVQNGSPEALRRAGLLYLEIGDHTQALRVFFEVAAQQTALSQEAALRALAIADRIGDTLVQQSLLPLLNPGTCWLREEVPVVGFIDVVAPPDDAPAIETAAYLEQHWGDEYALVEMEIAARTEDDALRVIYGTWLKERGEYRVALRIASSVLPRYPTRTAYELAYPIAFSEHVQSAASEFGIDPWLVLAVMREESHFDAGAVSRAGALGLMQIMPATGREIANRLRIAYDESQLLEPSTNIRMGSWYLSSMLNRYNGDIPRAVGAYNAGPGNMDRWSRTEAAAVRAHFIEAVAFAETRAYLLRVLNSWVIYHTLYAERPNSATQ